MNLIEQIKRDREAGTPGPWHALGGHVRCTTDAAQSVGKRSGTVADMRLANGENDARRIARVPEMEAALIDAEPARLAAEELAKAAGAMTGRKPNPLTGGRMILEVDCENLEAALSAYRKATEGAQ